MRKSIFVAAPNAFIDRFVVTGKCTSVRHRETTAIPYRHNGIRSRRATRAFSKSSERRALACSPSSINKMQSPVRHREGHTPHAFDRISQTHYIKFSDHIGSKINCAYTLTEIVLACNCAKNVKFTLQKMVELAYDQVSKKMRVYRRRFSHSILMEI